MQAYLIPEYPDTFRCSECGVKYTEAEHERYYTPEKLRQWHLNCKNCGAILGEKEETMKVLKVLIACEESQRVCTEFRKLGHEAYSADIQEPSGGHPEWHIHGDVLKVLNGGEFRTMDGAEHTVEKWDLIVAHPPCTYLTVSGNAWFNIERYGDKARKRHKDREDAAKFFMEFANAECDHIAIENPIGYMNTHYRESDEIIQPYEFGHPVSKATCLWLKGLPTLQATNKVRPELVKSGGKYYSGPALYVRDENGKILSYNDPRTAKERSKTFPGIAQAMAQQWSDYLTGNADIQLSLL